MNKALITGLLLAAGALLVAGCHSAKKATDGNPRTSKVSKKDKKKAGTKITDTTAAPGTTVLSAADLALAQRLNERAGFSGNFRTFSGRAKARLDRDGESNEFTANIRIRNGEAIWINVSALGGIVNVARIYVTPDSVRMVNFLQKAARLLPFAEAGNLLPFPVSFGDLQALLIGYAPATTALQPRGIQALPDRLLVFNVAESGEQTHFFSLPDTVLTGYSISQKSGSAEKVALSMAMHTLSGESGIPFFRERTATWQTGDKNGELQLHFDAPQWNGDLSMPFSVPKGYEVN